MPMLRKFPEGDWKYSAYLTQLMRSFQEKAIPKWFLLAEFQNFVDFATRLQQEPNFSKRKHFLQSTLSSLLSSVEIWASSSPPHPQVEDHGQDESIHDFLEEVKVEVRVIFHLPLHQAN